jgi:hypothetical protein
MEVSGQLHAPADLPRLGKSLRHTVGRSQGGRQGRSGRRREEEILARSAIEPRPSSTDWALPTRESTEYKPRKAACKCSRNLACRTEAEAKLFLCFIKHQAMEARLYSYEPRF